MKRLFMLLCAVVAFAACEQAPIEEAHGVADSNRSLSVSFDGGDDTRIQLQNGKTVWTKGDHVSVFYRSTVNEEWQFMGETGDRIGNIVPVDNSVNPPATHNHVVVAYPYSADYFYNTDTYNVEASLPAVQSYLKDSYGTNGNIMISSSEFNKVSLKSVCGWLKLQLTGDGETVKSITLRGNDGEQVAGLIYVDSAAATATLASAMGDAGDGEVGGTLVRPDTILTEVTLDCGKGVALGKNATAFYIALPPQTFTQGFTVEIEDTEGYVMEQSTDKALTIERNTIQPMKTVEFEAEEGSYIPNNQIWYTSSDGNIVTPSYTNVFGANITSNTYNNGMGIITFDGDVTTIGSYAFYCRSSLTSVNIPDSVTTIGRYAFYDCTSLKEFTGKFAEDNGRILVVDGVLTAFAPAGITEYNISDSVTTIGESAFDHCTSLTSVNIPDSVTTIGEYAFRYCTSLTSVNIPDSVTTIGYSAFRYCDSLTTVNIPDSVTEIGEGVFAYCTSLTSVNIPDSVTTIGESAFDHCTSLTSVNIPDSVTTIGKCAFRYCTSLTSVNIPDSVTTIGQGAFVYCTSLTSVNIGDNVTSIGYDVFDFCDSLKEFTGKFAEDNGRILVVDGVLTEFAPAGITEYNIPDSVTKIGEEAFRSCDSLTSVNIPDSVTTIENYAFEGCDSLTSVTIGDSVATIGNFAFYSCDSLASVNIPDSVTTIGHGAFRECYSLTSITIPDSVTSIGNYAFERCSSLTSVTIGDSVATIGDSAFRNCDSLTSVYCKATTPPALGGFYVFYSNGSGRKIYVPAGSVNAYKSATRWSEYASDIVGYDFENDVVVE